MKRYGSKYLETILFNLLLNMFFSSFVLLFHFQLHFGRALQEIFIVKISTMLHNHIYFIRTMCKIAGIFHSSVIEWDEHHKRMTLCRNVKKAVYPFPTWHKCKPIVYLGIQCYWCDANSFKFSSIQYFE